MCVSVVIVRKDQPRIEIRDSILSVICDFISYSVVNLKDKNVSPSDSDTIIGHFISKYLIPRCW